MKSLLSFYFAMLFSAGLVPSVLAQTPSPNPLQQIDEKRRELQLKHVMEKGRLLKDLQSKATAKGDLENVTALQALLDAAMIRYQQLQKPGAAPVPAAGAAQDASYHKQLQGRVWKCRGEKTDFDLSFKGAEATFDYSNGETFKYQTVVVWPGLLRYKHPSGQTSYLVFDDQGASGAFIRYTTEFPGELMSSKGD